MSDIELIIRIPEEIRLALIHNIQLSLDQKSISDSYIRHAIICGKPLDGVLDEIKAEIEEYRSTIDNAISEDELKIEGMKEAYTDCLEIIDKYKAESVT